MTLHLLFLNQSLIVKYISGTGISIACFKLANSIFYLVQISGSVANGTTWTNIIPEGYRPKVSVSSVVPYIAIGTTTNDATTIAINSSGTVSVGNVSISQNINCALAVLFGTIP